MSDVLTSFFEGRYSNKKRTFNLSTHNENKGIDLKLKSQGSLTLIPKTELSHPFTRNYVKLNKDMNDITNIHRGSPNIASSWTKNTSCTDVNNTDRTLHSHKKQGYRQKILLEAKEKYNELLSDKKPKLHQWQSSKDINPTGIFNGVLDPRVYIQQRLMKDYDKNSVLKSNDIILSCLGSTYDRDVLINGVNDYKSNIEKYQQIQDNLVNNHQESRKEISDKLNAILKTTEKKEDFKFKDYTSRKKKVDLAKFPIDMIHLPRVDNFGVDYKIQQRIIRCEKLQKMVDAQRNSIEKKISILNMIK